MGLFRKKKKRQPKEETGSFDINTGNDFEHLLAMYFEAVGANKVKVTPPTNDGGKDIIFYLDKKKHIVECKRFLNGGIGRPMIQQFHSAIIDERADAGMFVTTSYFTREAQIYAAKHGILLWNRKTLVKELKKVGIDLTFT
ncbi:hypothetical protein GCM10010443_93220 [Actinoplanes cyaneus]|uniref:restriction endonuclease n=1 Tax=Actinoplanes cyaneus TaxID=52696 RepID=UPI0031D9F7A1